jgi:hypothetical protein
MSPDLMRTVQRGCDTGAWLSVLPSPMAGTELSADEFCYSLSICYGRNPTGLQPTCDGYYAMFSACHAFSCTRGGLVIIRHNEIRDELCDMASKLFTLGGSQRTENQPMLCFQGRNVQAISNTRGQMRCSNPRLMGTINILHPVCTGGGHRCKNLQRQRSI